MKMSSSLSKILETEINVFKSNFQIIKNEKYYEISTIYECVGKLSMIIGCNAWMICLELNLFFFDPSRMLAHTNSEVATFFLQLSEFDEYDATDRNSDPHQ